MINNVIMNDQIYWSLDDDITIEYPKASLMLAV